MDGAVPNLLGQLDPASAFLFPDDPRGLPDTTGPRSIAIPGSSSRELRLLSRVCFCHKPARWPQPPSASLGVSSLLRDDGSRSPLIDRLPMSCLCSALSVSHTLDGFLLLALCELISSHCHVRDSLCRGFPRCPADLTHRQLVLS